MVVEDVKSSTYIRGCVMKIRASFVANSSSSSFIIAVKGELTKEKIKKMINADTLVDRVADYIMENNTTFQQFASHHCEEDGVEEYKDVVLRDCDINIDSKEYDVYTLETSSYGDDGPINNLLHHNHEVFTGSKEDIEVGLYI